MYRRISTVLVIAVIAAGPAQVCAVPSPTVITGVGGNNTSVTPGTANAALSAFEASIGGINNGNSTAINAGGFRAVSWESQTDAQASPNLLPANYYNSAQPRGVMLLTPGVGVAVSSNASLAVQNFGDIDSNYQTNFKQFSPVRVFAPMQSNIVQIYFYRAGTILPATVRGFGAIFNDVEFANTTSIHFFAFDGSDLGKYFAPAGTSGQSEFFGALFAPSDPPIGHVVITLGTNALGAGINDSGTVDVVVMDDIVYAEPHADLIFADGFQ